MTAQSLRRLLSIADQGGQAFGNLVVTVLLARWLPVEGFAEIATALTVWFFFEALQRTGIIVPYIAEIPHPKEDPVGHSSWFAINIIFLVAGTVLLVVLGQILPGMVGAGVYYAGYIVPTAGWYFYTRRILYHENRVVVAFCISALNVILMFAVLFLMYLKQLPVTVASAVGLYAMTYLVAGTCAFFFIVGGISQPRKVFGYLRRRLNTIQVMSLGASCAYLYNNGIQLVVAAFATAQETAAFSATRVLVRPLNVISRAVADIERSAASRAYHSGGDIALNDFVLRMFKMLLVLLVPIGALLFWFTPDILKLLFADNYTSYETTARLWILALLPQVFEIPLEMKKSIKGQGKSILSARFSGAVGSLATIFGSIAVFGLANAWIGVAAVAVGRLVTVAVMLYKSP